MVYGIREVGLLRYRGGRGELGDGANFSSDGDNLLHNGVDGDVFLNGNLSGARFKIQDSGFRVQGAGSRVRGFVKWSSGCSGFRVFRVRGVQGFHGSGGSGTSGGSGVEGVQG